MIGEGSFATGEDIADPVMLYRLALSGVASVYASVRDLKKK